MMEITHDIIEAQSIIKKIHTPTEYNNGINRIKAIAGDDLEVLAYMADDKLIGHHERMFAVAAMGCD